MFKNGNNLFLPNPMNFSKAFKLMCEHENCNGALEDPEEFLGPNYETVLNFWSWIDTLTEDQKKEVNRRWHRLDTIFSTLHAVEMAARNVIGPDCEIVAWDSLNGFAAAAWATDELIAMHDILGQGKELIFVPLFANP
jgi:hypothetical protein